MTVLRPAIVSPPSFIRATQKGRSVPASDMAETVRNKLSVYDTLWNGVEEPQKMRDDTRHVEMK